VRRQLAARDGGRELRRSAPTPSVKQCPSPSTSGISATLARNVPNPASASGSGARTVTAIVRAAEAGRWKVVGWRGRGWERGREQKCAEKLCPRRAVYFAMFLMAAKDPIQARMPHAHPVVRRGVLCHEPRRLLPHLGGGGRQEPEPQACQLEALPSPRLVHQDATQQEQAP